MDNFLQVYLDACRWWAFGGAFLAVPPLYTTLKRVLDVYSFEKRYSQSSKDRLIVEKTGLMFCIVGTMIGGAFLPLSTRFPEFAAESFTYNLVMGVAWTFWSLAVWAVAFALARSRPIMVMAALVWGCAVWMATIATGGV